MDIYDLEADIHRFLVTLNKTDKNEYYGTEEGMAKPALLDFLKYMQDKHKIDEAIKLLNKSGYNVTWKNNTEIKK